VRLEDQSKTVEVGKGALPPRRVVAESFDNYQKSAAAGPFLMTLRDAQDRANPFPAWRPQGIANKITHHRRAYLSFP